MPMVRELLKEMSGKEPCIDVLPDQCVAIGAAYAAYFQRDYVCSETSLDNPGCESLKKSDAKSGRSNSIGNIKLQSMFEKGLSKKLSSDILLDEFEKIDRFLTRAKMIDTFQHCHTVYDLFKIKDKNAPYSEIEKQLNEFGSIYSRSAAPKFAMFNKTVLKDVEVIKRTLKDYKKEYDHYLLENDPRVKKIKEIFNFCTKYDGILDSKVKSDLIEEGMEIGLSSTLLSDLIELWVLENGIREETSSADVLSLGKSDEPFKTYYEILGVSQYADYTRQKAAYEKEYVKYIQSRGQGKSESMAGCYNRGMGLPERPHQS